MAVSRLSAILSTFAILYGSFVYVCQSCSPEGWWPRTLTDDILMADSVLYGVVRKTYPDPRIDTTYTVEMEVYCILKGSTTPSVVNITGGGHIPGHCSSSKFVAGGAYIVLAYKTSNALFSRSDARGEINATQENLNDIAKACGLNPVTRPEGSSSSIECPVSVPDCQREPTPREVPFQPFKPKDPGEQIDDKRDDKPTGGSAATATVATTLVAAATVALAIVGV